MLGGQEDLIARATAVVRADERIQAAWLAGSFAAGTADEYSDVDLHCLVDSPLNWRELAERIVPDAVLYDAIPGVDGGVVITPEWLHLDVVLRQRQGFVAPPRFRTLLDRVGALGEPPTPEEDREPYFPLDKVNLYFYFLGNLKVVLGRGELLLLMNGSVLRRDVGLIPLMLAENGVRKSDGAKRLNRYLTQEQLDFLYALPPLETTVESCVHFDRLVATEVIRRGRALAAKTNSVWPDALEAATLRYLGWELPH